MRLDIEAGTTQELIAKLDQFKALLQTGTAALSADQIYAGILTCADAIEWENGSIMQDPKSTKAPAKPDLEFASESPFPIDTVLNMSTGTNPFVYRITACTPADDGDYYWIAATRVPEESK